MSRRVAGRTTVADAAPPLTGPALWHDILRDYDQVHAKNGQTEIDWFGRQQPSLRVAIETAARAINDRGKRYDHQYRIWRAAIPRAVAALLAVEERIAGTNSFDELLHLIIGQLRGIPGVGELYFYDTAFRIGAYLGIFPTRVYLHAGTRIGAARALSRVLREDALEMSELPSELQQREPYVVENIFCIYADRFAGRPVRAGRAGRC